MTVLAKPAKSFFWKCDLDLTLTYEVIQRGSSNISMSLCAKFIWLETENFIKIGRQTSEILQIFLLGVILPPWFFMCGENLVHMSVKNCFINYFNHVLHWLIGTCGDEFVE